MRKQHVYFLGLEHPTMAGLAVAIKQLNFAVTGVAVAADQALAQQLTEAGIHYYHNYHSQHLDPDSLVVVAPHITKLNPELKMAQQMKLEIVSLPQLIQQIAQNQHQIVVIDSPVAAALIANSLQQTDYRADFIGSQLVNTTNHWPDVSAVHFSAQPWLVIDSQWQPASILDKAAQWLYFQPHLLVIGHNPIKKCPATFYKDLQHLLSHSQNQAKQMIEPTVVIADSDKQAIQVVKQSKLKYVIYGQTSAASWRANKIKLGANQVTFEATYKSETLPIQTDMLGHQAIADILATVAINNVFGLDSSHTLSSLGNSNGLYYDHHLYSSSQDIHLVETSQPWPEDSRLYFDHFRQHFILDKSSKFWLLHNSSTPIDKLDLSAIDVLVELEQPGQSPSQQTHSLEAKLNYRLPQGQAAHFMAQHLQPGDLVCHLHADWQTSDILAQLVSAISVSHRRQD